MKNLDLTPIFETGLLVNSRTPKSVAEYAVLESVECLDWFINESKRKEDIFGEAADTIMCIIDMCVLEVEERLRDSYDLEMGKPASNYIQDTTIEILNSAIKEKCKKWLNKCSNTEENL